MRRALFVVLTVAVAAGALADQAAERAAGAKIGIPDLDTSRMQPLVRDAIDKARRAVIAEPKGANAWATLAVTLDAHELFQLAKQCYWRAHELDGTDFRYIYLYAVMSDFTGSPAAEVIPLLEKASKLEPEFPPLWVRVADLHMKSGALADARRALDKAIAIDGEFGLAHLSLGNYFLRTQDYAKAVEHLEKAQAQASDDRRVNSALARAYARVGEREKAKAAATETRKGLLTLGDGDGLRAEVSKMAVDSISLYDRGKRQFENGRFRAAIRNLKEVVKVRPHDASAHAYLGRAYAGRGNEAKAVEHLQTAVNLQPKLPIFHYRFAEVLLQLRRPGDARKECDAVLELMPDHIDALTVRGMCRVHLNELAGAIEDFEKAAGLGTISAQGQMMWGVAYARGKDLENAAKHFRLATEAGPKLQPAWVNLAYALDRLGDVGGAIAACRKVLELDPSHAKIAALLETLKKKADEGGEKSP